MRARLCMCWGLIVRGKYLYVDAKTDHCHVFSSSLAPAPTESHHTSEAASTVQSDDWESASDAGERRRRRSRWLGNFGICDKERHFGGITGFLLLCTTTRELVHMGRDLVVQLYLYLHILGIFFALSLLLSKSSTSARSTASKTTINALASQPRPADGNSLSRIPSLSALWPIENSYSKKGQQSAPLVLWSRARPSRGDPLLPYKVYVDHANDLRYNRWLTTV